MPGKFVDSNVLLYLLGEGRKADIAEDVLRTTPTISVQVLNECLNVCRRKLGLPWPRANDFAEYVRKLCRVVPVTETIHMGGRVLGERYRLQTYDAMIVAAAVNAGCDTLLSEDMQDGLVIDRVLTIQNPFA